MLTQTPTYQSAINAINKPSNTFIEPGNIERGDVRVKVTYNNSSTPIDTDLVYVINWFNKTDTEYASKIRFHFTSSKLKIDLLCDNYKLLPLIIKDIKHLKKVSETTDTEN